MDLLSITLSNPLSLSLIPLLSLISLSISSFSHSPSLFFAQYGPRMHIFKEKRKKKEKKKANKKRQKKTLNNSLSFYLLLPLAPLSSLLSLSRFVFLSFLSLSGRCLRGGHLLVFLGRSPTVNFYPYLLVWLKLWLL